MKRRRAAIAVAGLCSAIMPAEASSAVGLVGDKTLVLFDTEKPVITQERDVSGVDRLVGIDWNSQHQRLEGVTSNGDIVGIDPSTGKSALIAKMATTIPTGETPVVIDINPATGSIRFMTGSTNHRVNPETGDVTVDSQLAYIDGDPNASTLPSIAAAAYTNAYGKAKTTALYSIDGGARVLVHQTMPNDGALKTVGSLGVSDADSYAFDIETTAKGGNIAWLVAGQAIYRVDLETGKANKTGAFEGLKHKLKDFSVLGAETKPAQ